MRCDAVHTSASLAFHMGQFFITGFMLKDIIIFYIVFVINNIEAPQSTLYIRVRSICLDPGPHYFVLKQTDLRTLPLLRGMFLGTTLCLFSTKLLEDINTPAERIIVPLIPVELVESFEFGVRDREVCTVSIAQHQIGF